MAQSPYVSRREVLARMKRGDLPMRLDYNAVQFDDGAKVRFATVRGLEKDGLIVRPTGTVVGDRFTLAAPAHITTKPVPAKVADLAEPVIALLVDLVRDPSFRDYFQRTADVRAALVRAGYKE
ncbi:MAG: hypothetical protein ACXWHZ_03720 [Usitatibacter sp.]